MSADEIVSNFLREADEAERQEEAWAIIKGHLEEAERNANGDNRLIGKVNANRAKLETRRDNLIKTLFNQLHAQLQETPFIIENVRKTMQRIAKIAIDSQAVEAQLTQFEVDILTPREKESEADGKYQELLAALEEAWQKGDEAFRTTTEQTAIVAQYFEEPYHQIEAEAPSYPHYKPMQALLERAKTRYDEARDKALLPKTYDQIKDREKELKFYELQLEKDKDYRPVLTDENGQERSYSLLEAIALTKKRIGVISRDRAVVGERSYLSEANNYLASHNPKAANAKLQDALDLPELDDLTRAELTNFFNNHIRGELDAYNNAERDADDAIKATFLEDALKNLRSAKEKYEWADRVKQAEMIIRGRAQTEFNGILKNITEDIEDNKLVQGRDQLSALRNKEIYWQILSRAELDEQLSLAERRIEHIRKESNFIADTRNEVQALVKSSNYERANDVIRSFLEEYPNADRRDKELGNLYTQIQIHVDMERLPALLESAYESNDLAQIERAFENATEAITTNPNLAQTHKIPALRQKLEGRLKVLDAQAKMLKEETRQDASRLLEQVIGSSANAVDIARARDLSQQLRQTIELEGKLSNKWNDIDLLLREDSYKEAYDLLKPLMLDLPIKQEWQNKRDEAWGILTQGFIHRTQMDLEEMLEQKSDDLELLNLLRNRLRDLGAPNLGTLEERVEERIAVLQAERYEKTDDWDKAEKSWERAQDFNKDNIDYRKRFIAARRRRIRQDLNRLATNEEKVVDALQLTQRYIDQMPDLIEPRVWQLEILVLMAYFADSPRAFDTAWLQASNAITLTRFLVNNPNSANANADETKARTDFNKKFVPTVQKGQEHSAQLARLIRLLNMNQNLDVLNTSLDQMKAFIQTNSEYMGIGRWWAQEFYPKLISDIEARAKENAGDYWKSFGDYARLMILDEGHGEARLFVENMPRQLPTLPSLAHNAINNNTGASRNNENEENVVKLQIADTKMVIDHVETATDSTKFFKTLFKGKSIANEIGQLEVLLKDLNNKVLELETLEKEFNSALNLAQEDGALGDWHEFDKTVENIAQLYNKKYARHVVLTILGRTKQTTTDKRAVIATILTKMVDAFESQNIPELETELAKLDHEDKNDTYRLQRNMVFKEHTSRTSLNGVRALRTWLEKYHHQVSALKEWLCAILNPNDIDKLLKLEVNKVNFAKQQGILKTYPHLQHDQYFIDWERFLADDIEPARQKADFLGASRKALWALDGSYEKYGIMGMMDLQQSLSAIEGKFPFPMREIDSVHADFLMQLGEDLQRLFRNWISEARDYQQKIEKDTREFFDLLNGFDTALKSIANKKNATVIGEAKIAHQRLITLTPGYRGIYSSVDDYPLLQEQEG